MNPSDDTFYARISTLSDSELFNYTKNYSHYKVEAVQAAIAELRTRGFPLSHDKLLEIEMYFAHKDEQITRPFHFDPRQLRFLSYAIFIIGILSSVFIYFKSYSAPQNPLGYNPLDSKKYLHDLELYGGKINVMAVEFLQWFDKLWQGKNLSYIIAFITVIISSIFWFIGSHPASHLDTNSGKQNSL